MSGTLILLQLAGYVGLLLWGTYMVTSGVQRGFGAELRRWLGRNLQQRWRAFAVGLGITALLQSSTATALMATSFTVSGMIGLECALAVMLGANVGTTLITQVLSFDIGFVAPPVVLAGVLIFRSSDDDRIKNLGRALVGLGLMLLALGGLVHALAPVESAPVLRTLLDALRDQPVISLLLAAALTWACHSSVAVVLLIVSLTTTHAIAAGPALALVLGANVGGALPPLIEAGSPAARRLPLGNLLVRGLGCLFALPLLPLANDLLARVDAVPGRLVVNFHTAFNVVLAAVFLPCTPSMARLLIRMLPDPPKPADPARPLYLEASGLDSATIALTNASRETLRMADMVQGALRHALDVLRVGDRRRASGVSATGRSIDRLGSAIRNYLADLGNQQPLDDDEEGARAQEILSAVINIEHAGDIVGGSLMESAVQELARGRSFSPEEMTVIASIQAELLESSRLAIAVFLNGDLRQATQLVARKAVLRQMESEATSLHVRLLRDAAMNVRASDPDRAGRIAEETGTFLKIVSDLRRVHSHIASLAYPTINRAAAQHSAMAAELGNHEQ